MAVTPRTCVKFIKQLLRLPFAISLTRALTLEQRERSETYKKRCTCLSPITVQYTYIFHVSSFRNVMGEKMS